jgi:hypothetical protein
MIPRGIVREIAEKLPWGKIWKTDSPMNGNSTIAIEHKNDATSYLFLNLGNFCITIILT